MKNPLLLLFATLALTALVYSIGLDGPLVYDDAHNLLPINEWLRGNQSWQQVVFGNASGLFGRPMSMASFVLNVWMLGPHIWGLKLGNLILHLINGLLVYALFSMLRKQHGLTRPQTAGEQWLVLVGTTAWMLHPLLVSTVLYVVQRMAILSALFTLITLLSYLRGRIALSGQRKRVAVFWFATAAISTLLATLSKENGILAPSLCALIEWFIFQPPQGKRRATASRAFLVCTLLLPTVAAVVLTSLHANAIVGDYANRPFSLEERLLTQARVLWSYIGSLMMPFGPRLGLYHDDYAISHGFFSPATTAIAWAAWLSVLAVAWRIRRTVPGFALGIGIFLVGQSLESSVFPLLIYFEHRNYLPAIGVIWALLSLCARAVSVLNARMDNATPIFAFGAVALVAVFAFATAARSLVWQSQESLLAQGLAFHPQSRWVRIDLAQQAMQATPAQPSLARAQIDALLASNEPSTRRLAGVWQLLIDCSSAGIAAPKSKQLAFGGRAKSIEADVLMSLESLVDGVSRRPCVGLDRTELANSLVGMVTRADIPQSHRTMRRLRYRASQLYAESGDFEQALQQARLAYGGSAEDAPIGADLVALEIQAGNLGEASKLLLKVESQIPDEDTSGHEVVGGLRKQLTQALQAAPQKQYPSK